MKTLNMVESIRILMGLILFGVGNKGATVSQNYPWVQYLGLGLVFVTGLSDAIYRLVTKKSFLK